jgi:hypothetical protein
MINNGSTMAAACTGGITNDINGTPKTASVEPKPLFEIPINKTAKMATI